MSQLIKVLAVLILVAASWTVVAGLVWCAMRLTQSVVGMF